VVNLQEMTKVPILLTQKNSIVKGFTLIELMIVMSIVALLTGLVGPLAINSLEKAQAKEEMLSMKNWLRKISYRAFATGQAYTVKLAGKNIALHSNDDMQTAIVDKNFESLFFQPQELIYNEKGFVSPPSLVGSYRGNTLTVDLAQWVNGESANNDNE